MQMRLCRLIGNLSAHTIRFSLVLALAALLVPSRAMAVTAASATATVAAFCADDFPSSVSVGIPPGSLPIGITHAADTSAGGCNGNGSASALAQVAGGSAPNIVTSVSANGGIGYVATATGELSYYFEVDGPDGTIPVTIHGDSSLSTEYHSDGIDIIISTKVLVDGGSLFSSTGGPFDSPLDFDVDVGYEYAVYLLAQVSVETACPSGSSSTDDNCGRAASASAFVDPTFTIPDGYSIVFSPGITAPTAAATPLPATLPLFASGLGGLGLAAWRRKRKKAA